MIAYAPLVPGGYFHVYNRGVNGHSLFTETRNYPYFLELYAHYLEPVVETFAYCLLNNHFHFLLRVRTEAGVFELTQDLARDTWHVERMWGK